MLVTTKYPYYDVQEDRALPVVVALASLEISRMEKASPRHRYDWQEFYSEWGRHADGFFWENVPRNSRRAFYEFIAAAVDGNGMPRAVNCVNRDILWPGCPDWWRRA